MICISRGRSDAPIFGRETAWIGCCLDSKWSKRSRPETSKIDVEKWWRRLYRCPWLALRSAGVDRVAGVHIHGQTARYGKLDGSLRSVLNREDISLEVLELECP